MTSCGARDCIAFLCKNFTIYLNFRRHRWGLCGSSDIFVIFLILGESRGSLYIYFFDNYISVSWKLNWNQLTSVQYSSMWKGKVKKKKKFPENLRELLKADFASFWGDFKSVGSWNFNWYRNPKIINIYRYLDREISVIFRHFSPHRADGSTIGVKIGQKSHLSEKFQGFARAAWNDFHFQFCLHFNFSNDFPLGSFFFRPQKMLLHLLHLLHVWSLVWNFCFRFATSFATFATRMSFSL